jgi:hypothetical protein
MSCEIKQFRSSFLLQQTRHDSECSIPPKAFAARIIFGHSAKQGEWKIFRLQDELTAICSAWLVSTVVTSCTRLSAT